MDIPDGTGCVPKEFHESNKKKSDRSIFLAQLAKGYLIDKNMKVTSLTFIEATKFVDIERIGISHSTLYKNKAVHEIFLSIDTQILTKPKKRRRNRPSKSKRASDTILRKQYKDLSKLEIIRLIEEKEAEVLELERKTKNLRTERDELKRQNQNQLVYLSNLEKSISR